MAEVSQLAQFIEILRRHKPELERKYSVKSLGLFGSYVREDQKKRSDLDVLVEFHDPPGFFGFVQLERHLAELLGVKVDLVMKDALKPAIGRHILSEVVPV